MTDLSKRCVASAMDGAEADLCPSEPATVTLLAFCCRFLQIPKWCQNNLR